MKLVSSCVLLIFLFAYQFRIEFLLTRLAIGCMSFVWLPLHLNVFQWKPPCTALVFTALTRLLRLLRLCCAWIHLPASEKIGVQVSPLPPPENWDRLQINDRSINHWLVPLCIQKGTPQRAEQPRTSCTPPCVLTWSLRRRWKYRPKTVARTKTRTWASSWKNQSRVTSQSGRGKVGSGKWNPPRPSTAVDKKL